MSHHLLYISLAYLFGFIMTWSVGANDLANIMSTTIGSKAISTKNIIWIAIIFEFAGAILGGKEVTNTVRSGIVNVGLLTHEPHVLIEGMLALLMGCTIWMFVASVLGLPVSITNAVIGALIGFGWIMLGPQAIHWEQVGKIATSWLISPLAAAIASFALFSTIQLLILGRSAPQKAAEKYIPAYLFLVGSVLANMIVVKGLAHFGFVFLAPGKICLTLLGGIFVMLLRPFWFIRLQKAYDHTLYEQYRFIEKQFGILMALTACAMVFAHGSNDVAIAVGPISVITSIVNGRSLITQGATTAVVAFGCTGVVIGLFMYGRKVIETVGTGITRLTPSRAFAATIAAAATVVCSTGTGIPVSATQTLVGGVLGVGMARGIGALNLRVVRNILLSWLITIPAASATTIGCFYLFSHVFRL